MQPPEAPVVAEGEIASCGRWYLMAGGSSDDYYMGLKVFYEDGHGVGGGLQGPAFITGVPFQYCWSQNGDDPLSVMIGTENRVRRLHLHSLEREFCDLVPVAEDRTIGLAFFVTLLSWKPSAISVEGFDGSGQLLYRHPMR